MFDMLTNVSLIPLVPSIYTHRDHTEVKVSRTYVIDSASTPFDENVTTPILACSCSCWELAPPCRPYPLRNPRKKAIGLAPPCRPYPYLQRQ